MIPWMRRCTEGNGPSPPLILLCILVATCGIVWLLVGGCTERASAPQNTTDAAVSVRILFPDSREIPPSAEEEARTDSNPGSVEATRIQSIRVRAFENYPSDVESLRAEVTTTIAEGDTSFRLQLQLPVADLYRLVVNADGRISFGDTQSEFGTVYVGTGFVEDLSRGETKTVVIVMRMVVPLLSILVHPQQLFTLSWDEVAGGTQYRLKEALPDGSLLLHTTARHDTTIDFSAGREPGRWNYSVQALLSDQLESVFSDTVGLQIFGPICEIIPQSLEFGDVPIDSTSTLRFVIRNRGDGPFSGRVVEECDEYTISFGEGPFDLSPGGEWEVEAVFAPTSTGTSACTIFTHSSICNDLPCSGRGILRECNVSPAELDFASVELDSSRTLSFLIRNPGSEPLVGTVAASCEADFSIESGSGGYQIASGESLEVVVAFHPQTPGRKICTITTDNDLCGTVTCFGDGVLTSCRVEPQSLGFGPVHVDSSAVLFFRIHNDGNVPISGTVSAACEESWSILSGEGDYQLDAGAIHQVSIAFQPSSPGSKECVVETGNPHCESVHCTGTAILRACAVEPLSIDFGQVEIDSSGVGEFRIRNLGTEPLAGTISAPCDAQFSILAGEGSYELPGGDSLSVVVAFTPTGAGLQTCSILTGNPLCGPVECNGTGIIRACSVLPTDLDFGEVLVDSVVVKDFTIRNTGTVPIEGTVSAPCETGFSIVAGEGDYLLASGDSLRVSVQFAPSMRGLQICQILTGDPLCDEVLCVGSGIERACAVIPTALDFGDVTVDSSMTRSFTIRNTGTEPLTGNVSAPCETDFLILVGAGAYELSEGDSLEVILEFRPTGTGLQACVISTGNALCGEVTLTGVGIFLECAVSPPVLDFGDVPVDSTAVLSFQIINRGTEPLSGTVGSQCGSEWLILSGAGPYQLSSNETWIVEVELRPTSTGLKSCVISTGNPLCGAVPCSGAGVIQSCSIFPTLLDFEEVLVDSSRTLNFTITNTGTMPLSGTVSAQCEVDYSILSGLGPYELNEGGTHEVVVRFRPWTIGQHDCIVRTGNDLCGDVSCTGTAIHRACRISPTTLDFGGVELDSSRTSSFSITNIGTETLSGTVSIPCDANFSISSGSGFYQLEQEQVHEVVVQFHPTAPGNHVCTILTGNELCSDVACIGNGLDCTEFWRDEPDFSSPPLSSEQILSIGLESETANDFILDAYVTITRVTWWGSYWNNYEGTPTDAGFNLRIYEGDACSPMPEPIIEFILTSGEYGETYAVGGDMFSQYVYSYETSFGLSAGSYWFSAQMADHAFPPQWGRLGATTVLACDTMFRSDYFSYPTWTPVVDITGTPFDAAQSFCGFYGDFSRIDAARSPAGSRIAASHGARNGSTGGRIDPSRISLPSPTLWGQGKEDR